MREQMILWWLDWSWCNNVVPGNRWLERCIYSELREDEKDQVYEKYLSTYQEVEDNQI